MIGGCKSNSAPPARLVLPMRLNTFTAGIHRRIDLSRRLRPSGPITFTDVTAQAGIHFKHNSGAFGEKYLPETMGSGVCIIDYDNDGWQDIFFVNSTNWPGTAAANPILLSITTTTTAPLPM
jgi:hypothetical protein